MQHQKQSRYARWKENVQIAVMWLLALILLPFGGNSGDDDYKEIK